MTKIIIPVHSVVDLITNSSSELYTSATDNTVKTIKEYTDALLSLAGSKLKTDDIFEVKLEVADDSGNEYTFDPKPVKDSKEAAKVIKLESARRARLEECAVDEYANWPRISSKIVIEPKPKYASDPSIKPIIDALAKLGNTFETEDVSNY